MAGGVLQHAARAGSLAASASPRESLGGEDAPTGAGQTRGALAPVRRLRGAGRERHGALLGFLEHEGTRAPSRREGVTPKRLLLSRYV
jgi:hypothetical protein